MFSDIDNATRRSCHLGMVAIFTTMVDMMMFGSVEE
jgi:hypothetical protein